MSGEFVGKTYRQLAYKLRVQRGPGNADMVSTRPAVAGGDGKPKRDAAGNIRFLDTDEAPTLVTFDELCQVNVAFLLRTGAIVEWQPPLPVADEAEDEVRDG